MIRIAGREALDGARDGMKAAGKAGGRLFGEGFGRIGGRAALKRGKRLDDLGGSPGAMAVAAVLAGLAVAAVILYLRKRRQVAEHYNMGENEGAWEGGTLRGQAAFESARG
jgi:hypothetical protein